MRLSHAKATLGLEEEELRAVCKEYGIPLGKDEDDHDTVEITPVLRIAVNLDKVKSKSDEFRTLRESSQSRAQTANDVSVAAPNAETPDKKWPHTVSALAAVGAAGAAIGAVWIASEELSRAVDTFKIGNQYQYQNDFVSAFEGLQSEEPSAILVSMNERFRLGQQIEAANGFPESFWEEYTTSACGSLIASQCEQIPGLDAAPTVSKKRFAGYDSVMKICYANYSEQDDICE